MIHHRHHLASSHNHCMDKEIEHTLDYLSIYARVVSLYTMWEHKLTQIQACFDLLKLVNCVNCVN